MRYKKKFKRKFKKRKFKKKKSYKGYFVARGGTRL